MIRFLILITALALTAGSQVSALSCMAPDVRVAFETAQKAAERYIVATGTLRFDASKLPKAILNDSPPKTMIPARLSGQALTKTGFDLEFDRAVALELLCFGPWCGGAGSGTTYLAFLRESVAGYVISVDPCGSLIFYEPSQEMLNTVARCFQDGHCPTP